MPYCWKPVRMIAAVAEVGRPSVSNGISAVVTDALFAASGPATPSIAPLPNSSGCLVSFFSVAYERNVGISAPPAGIAPNGTPNAVPRSHGITERLSSATVITSEPLIRSTVPTIEWWWLATYSVSPTANRPTATTTTSTPSNSSWMPMAKRICPDSASVPIMPMNNPTNSAAKPRSADEPSSAEIVVNASSINANFSAGPNCNPHSATTGANSVTTIVAIVPATNEPSAAVASAAPARPRFAIMLPSSVVAIDADSPGELSRIDVVEPPYIAP